MVLRELLLGISAGDVSSPDGVCRRIRFEFDEVEQQLNVMRLGYLGFEFRFVDLASNEFE
jgi:hypothetical protein